MARIRGREPGLLVRVTASAAVGEEKHPKRRSCPTEATVFLGYLSSFPAVPSNREQSKVDGIQGDLLCVPISIPMEARVDGSHLETCERAFASFCKALVVQLQTAHPTTSRSEIVRKAAPSAVSCSVVMSVHAALCILDSHASSGHILAPCSLFCRLAMPLCSACPASSPFILLDSDTCSSHGRSS